MTKSRKPNNASTIYRGKDGYWHGRVTVGVRDDGRPDRRHVMASTQAEIVTKVRKLEQERGSGTTRKASRKVWTVESWLMHWLENIATPFVKENTARGYRVAVTVHLVPGIGKHRLDKLEPEHLERLYVRMMQAGQLGGHRAPGAPHHPDRAQRSRAAAPHVVEPGQPGEGTPARGRGGRAVHGRRDPAPPRARRARSAPARGGPSHSRSVSGRAKCSRCRWPDLDLDTGRLVVRRSRLRPKWVHGCEKPCGRKYPGYCPERRPAREESVETKSRAGRRTIGLPDELVALLRKHRDEQDRERETAGQLWTEGGWVFATPTGGPTNHRTDYDEWKRLLVRAGVRDGRLHDARHTAATVMLLLGVPERAVMGLMGWSNSAMAARYQHITGAVQRDVARRVGGLLWQAGEGTDDAK